MNKEIKQKLTPIIVAALLMLVAAESYSRPEDLAAVACLLVPYFVAGWEVLSEGAEKLLQGEPLDEDFLMGVATIGALAIAFMPEAEPQFTEAVFVMLFYRVGEFFEWLAEGRSRRSIAALMDIRPDTATVLRDGVEQVVDPSTVEIGEIILIKAGEKVPWTER